MQIDDVKSALSGPVASVYATFHEDGTLDDQGPRNLLDAAVDAGSKPVLMTYGNTLYSLLTDQEMADFTKMVAEHTAGRAMVVAADRIWWTGKTVDFAHHCNAVGVDMLMVLPPSWGGSLTADSLVNHYTAVAEQIPVMMVTNLFADNRALGMAVIKRLLDEVPGVMAVKDDLCGTFGQQLSLTAHEKWGILSGGRKQNHLDVWAYGCDGYLSSFILFKPAWAHTYWNAIQQKDIATATCIIRDYELPYFDLIRSLPGGFDAGKHAAFELFGLAKRWRRSPYASLSDADMERVKAFFTDRGCTVKLEKSS